LEARIYRAEPLEIGLRLPKAKAAIGTAKYARPICFILTVIVPKADFADLVLATTIQGLEFATWTPKAFGRLNWFPYPANPVH
jgi:hypothetical protein